MFVGLVGLSFLIVLPKVMLIQNIGRGQIVPGILTLTLMDLIAEAHTLLRLLQLTKERLKPLRI